MSENRKDVNLAFLEAVEKPTAQERAAYLDEVCRDDPALRAEMESLLVAHDKAGGFLEIPILEPTASPASSPLSEGPGTVVGRYKLLEKIGEGGMAVVYMAEQEQPIRRKVALKIIKLGMDTKQVIARFEAERQALAMMDHPNIARVLDAGATETGRPYFVMELVQGVSITEYCDRNSLSTKERLALFTQVCHAVQHAHQKGIIHRDIKPSNVMVTMHDGVPVPKVIDFGIAKATNQRLTQKTLFTRYAHIIGTPAYMSPEQAELSDVDIDTRSDIYSLGVLLYELLTGTTPFSEEELRQAGYTEMQRIICEQEPVKPSTRIRAATRERRSVGAGPRACPTSGGHGGPPLQEVRGDLDWIVMKSLQKDRTRRYETANGLALDVQRHLESEPVLARAPRVMYRLHKFVYRHRTQLVAVLALVVLIGSAAITLSTWNQNRLQSGAAEAFEHRSILSEAREAHAKGEFTTALEYVMRILASRHVGPEARLLRAGILVDDRRYDDAVDDLEDLLEERPAIAGAAYVLLARSLWEDQSLDAEKRTEIEEYRRRAEELLPKTAEAYFLRAMSALTIKEQLAALDKALQLDSTHYESRRLRAFTYYASKKHERMKDDALVLSILRPKESMGCTLRAIALRALGEYEEAIDWLDSAIELTSTANPRYIELNAQRCETLLWMGEYERIIADAQDCLRLFPDEVALHFHVFCALTALGDYDKAGSLFQQVSDSDPAARSRFRDWSMKYVSDTLDAGRSWHPPEHAPDGIAFLAMREAEEIYHYLSAQGATPLIGDGFAADWHPEGKKLAFSVGVRDTSGLAIFDPASRETELLIVPGRDPKWSPDGRYIAFVRDRSALRPQELTAAERRYRYRHPPIQEVWIIAADGTDPRRLADGVWPSWSQDSKQVYYRKKSIGLSGSAA